jgi:hypothetical protein
MSKIKNDPKKYAKRSHLPFEALTRLSDKEQKRRPARTRNIDFLAAEIDAAGYIDFRMIKPKRSRE